MEFDELKEKLLSTNCFEDNEYLDQYCELIVEDFPILEHYQIHHIIPRSYFKSLNVPCDDSQANLKCLSGGHHILAHYYLYKCSKDSKMQAANFIAFNNMMNNSKYNYELTSDQINLLKNSNNDYPQFQHSIETRLKMSASAKKRVAEGHHFNFWDYGHQANRGKKRSPEIIQKMRETHLGKFKMSEEAKLKISKANSHPQSEEHKLKRSQARKAYYNNMTEEEKRDYYKMVSLHKGIPVYCIELDRYFLNSSAASRELNIDSSTIRRACKNPPAKAGGYHWKEISKEEFNNIKGE